MVLYDRHEAEARFTPGTYVTDQKTLWRILDLAERRNGLLPLEDCRFPDAAPVWRSVEWLSRQRARVVRPCPALEYLDH